MAVTDKIYLADHRRIAAQVGTRFPKRAFSGATLDLLFAGGEDLDALDDATRERVLAFAEDFLACECDANPFCGHPERKFIRYLLERRADGLDPAAIVSAMKDEYGLYAYPGDVLSFLDDAVRTLDAAEDLAEVTANDRVRDRVRRARDALVR